MVELSPSKLDTTYTELASPPLRSSSSPFPVSAPEANTFVTSFSSSLAG